MFELPHASTVDGITLQTSLFPVVFQERLDDTRLRENDVVLATYPRTGRIKSFWEGGGRGGGEIYSHNILHIYNLIL